MIESASGNENNEGSPELEQHKQAIRELIGGEEGELLAQHEELRFELGRTLQELIEKAPDKVSTKIAADPQQYVDENLTAPEDSALRQQVIAQFEPVPEAGEFVEFLKEMEELVTAT